MRCEVVAFALVVVFIIGRVAAQDDEDDNSPQAQEEKYRPVIKCASCERVAKALAGRAQNESIEKFHAPRGKSNHMSSQQHKRALRAARAAEFIEGACDQEAGRDKIYCEQAVERFEDQFTVMIMADGKHPKYESPEDICKPACDYKTHMKEQIDQMTSNLKKQHQRTITQEVLDVFLENWVMWVGFFFGTLGLATWIQLRVLARMRRDKVEADRRMAARKAQ